jgi:predicted RNase H-like HicB family nuclease
MDRIRVIYHDESPHGWWAESPDVKGWSAAGASYDEVHALAEDGVRFALRRDDVMIAHLVPASA